MNPIMTPTEPPVTIRRTFAASRARFCAAWTDVAIIRQWFAPDGRITDARWDAREGDTYRVAMTVANDAGYVVSGVFSTVRPPERLAFTFRWEEDDPALERDRAGWSESLDNLANFLLA